MKFNLRSRVQGSNFAPAVHQPAPRPVHRGTAILYLILWSRVFKNAVTVAFTYGSIHNAQNQIYIAPVAKEKDGACHMEPAKTVKEMDYKSASQANLHMWNRYCRMFAALCVLGAAVVLLLFGVA